ncbi:MAG TPA: SPOR domain-containing protein [Myxococcota bacterium]|nr:SPOR domain-containing protein [Myxococcota bacterium]
MTEREPDSRRSNARGRGPGAARYLYGALLVAIGACIGIVIGSVSDTPRMLLERMRGPVETVDLETPAPAAAQPAAAPAEPPLEAFNELQGGERPKPAPAAKAPAAAAPPAAPRPAVAALPKPAAEPPVSSPPPAAAGKPTVIQVLSLAQRSQADALVIKLKAQGFDPYVTAMPDKSGRFRVRVRSGGQDPVALEAKLRALGLKTWATTE